MAAAVSLLPASLPAVVALSLSNASKTLADNNALVRKMDAIETLAAVTDVCSDKTGTITLGKMVMQKAWVPADLAPKNGEANVDIDCKRGQLYAVETGSDPYYPRGRVMAIESHEKGDVFGDDDDDDDPERSQDLVDKDSVEPPLRDMVLCASLCSSATIQRSTDKEDEGKGKWEAHGDATEIALLVVSTDRSCSISNADSSDFDTSYDALAVGLQARTWTPSPDPPARSQANGDSPKRHPQASQEQDWRTLRADH